MPAITYDQELREGEHGRRLYSYWKKVKADTTSPVFLDYPNFYKWSIDNGYRVGARLFKHDITAPYSPDNSFWFCRSVDVTFARDPDFEYLWDETVNRIRRHFGLEPIHSAEV